MDSVSVGRTRLGNAPNGDAPRPAGACRVLMIGDLIGKPGRQAGEFIRAHMIAIDSKNRMYTGEAGNGRRVQRFILEGTRPASSVQPPP